MSSIIHLLVAVGFLLSIADAKSPFAWKRQMNGQCSGDEVRCANGARCINTRWLCDGDNDCGDNWDEDSSVCHAHECSAGQLRCDNGQCIDEERFCTMQSNGCRDRSLDRNEVCSSVRCPEGRLMCGNGEQCISPRWLCDGDNDCGDNWDEQQENCASFECPSGQFKCGSTNRCISGSWLCDGDNDCGDNSDEMPETCSSHEFQCDPGYVQCPSRPRCIRESWLCDGDDDCGDNWDESQNCESMGLNVQRCHQAVGAQCVLPIVSQMVEIGPGVSEEVILEKIRSTDLKEICGVVIQMQECTMNVVSEQCRPDVLQGEDVRLALAIYNTSINYVCRQHVEVFNENKECLLRPGSYGPVPQLAMSLGNTCEQDAPHYPNHCPSTALVDCAENVISDQCGQEIAGHIRTLGTKILAEVNCSTGEYRRGMKPAGFKKSYETYKGFNYAARKEKKSAAMYKEKAMKKNKKTLKINKAEKAMKKNKKTLKKKKVPTATLR